jgi:hypothetical protein
MLYPTYLGETHLCSHTNVCGKYKKLTNFGKMNSCIIKCWTSSLWTTVKLPNIKFGIFTHPTNCFFTSVSRMKNPDICMWFKTFYSLNFISQLASVLAPAFFYLALGANPGSFCFSLSSIVLRPSHSCQAYKVRPCSPGLNNVKILVMAVVVRSVTSV